LNRYILQKREKKLNIHKSAIVSPRAQIAEGVRIGPYCIVDDNVKIAEGCILEAHVYITGNTEIKKDCKFYPFCSVGTEPQDIKYRGEKTYLKIGHRNVFREFATVNVGTAHGGGVTTIGNDNLFFAYSHIAHDCHIGNNVLFYNAGTLGGHVMVGDHATVGAFSGVHQFCRIGRHGFIGGYSVITKDVLPFSKTVGNRAKCYGINYIGLTRKGFSPEVIEKIKKAFRILLQSNLNTSQALEVIEKEVTDSPDIDYFVEFIRESQRGVIK
jgi:UDP-N-acetylglucosamine acyltransferase